MSEEGRVCVFCGSGPLTLEHVFPQWVVPLVETLGQPLSAARVTQHEERFHDVWNTSKVDFKARKVCGPCNSGWMAALEAAVKPILSPLILRTNPQSFTKDDALTLGTWVAKTVLTASLLHPDDTNPIPSKYFGERSISAPAHPASSLDRTLSWNRSSWWSSSPTGQMRTPSAPAAS